MTNTNYPNLKPWKKGQSGNPAGRKMGSKNVSTIVRELLEQDVSENKYNLENLKTALRTEKEFYELINLHLLDLLEMNDITKLDAICNELVTNLRSGNDSVPVIKLNPPYNLLVDLDKILTGRGERTRSPSATPKLHD